MQYRDFGNTGLKISALGFGSMRLPEKDNHVEQDKAIEVIHRAFELGVNYIDTAYFYNNHESEIVVGKALKGWRDKVAVSTKNHYYGEDESVAAILLHVDSPGGGVAVTQEIYEEIMRVRMEDEKLVVVSMTTVGASGAYYLACAADRVVANPGTLVGSIGVIMQYPVLGELLDKIGVDYETIKTGEVKDVGSPWREPTDRDREMLQSAIDDVYQQFVEAVMEGRNLTYDEVISMADGSIFTGRQALDLGLVDELGSFEEAIRLTGELAGIEGEPNTVQERPRRRVTIWDLLDGTLEDAIDAVYPNSGPELKYLYR